jgi:VIT1/CCC1 family predicted Fe2+/Mn2+ transporter
MAIGEHWHAEKQSAFLYRVLARTESAPKAKQLFAELADAAEDQARTWEGEAARRGESLPSFALSARARVVAALIQRFGGRRVRPALAAMKVRGLSIYSSPAATAGHVMPTSREDFGGRHQSVGAGGALRAAVFGVNDGLVSNASLILGVAGAGAEARVILLSGFAGLLAGAFSMAAGEYVSVRSQRELFEYQIGLEKAELDEYPEQETEELALIYRARGLELEQARTLAAGVMRDPVKALDTLAREELGLNPDDLGSPWRAAISSFLAFGLGAALPLVPYWFASSTHALALTLGISVASLFAVGCTLSLFTGRNALWSGARMVLLGSAAGTATWLVGRWLGVDVS